MPLPARHESGSSSESERISHPTLRTRESMGFEEVVGGRYPDAAMGTTFIIRRVATLTTMKANTYHRSP
jgi:hypothetical protein